MKRPAFLNSIFCRWPFAALVLLLAASLAHAQALSVTPFHQNGIYDPGEKAGWTVTLPPGAATAAAKANYTVKRNNFEAIQSGVLDLSSGSATIETTLREPAMLYVEVSGGVLGDASPIHLGAAIAPTRLQPSVARPADFDSFWEAKLKALGEVPIHPVLTPVPTSQPGVDLYTVTLDSLGSHVQGYLAKPSKEGKFPALAIFQYAGVYALQPKTVTDRAAEGWLAFDVDSHDIPPTQADGVAREYAAIGNTSRETSYFLNMYLRDARAIDYLASRSDWDGKTMVYMGTSMGGQQGLVTAALRPHATAVIVNEPSGADSNGGLHGRQSGYPYWPSRDPKVGETALYFDTVNFAPRIQAPLLIAIGFIDTTCPPAGLWTVVNQVSAPKEVVSMIESDHNNRTPEKQGAFVARSREVLGAILNGGEFKPR